MEKEVILDVKNLRTYFYTSDGVVPAVEDVSIQIHKGETLGIVGESGCGKSQTMLSVMRLIQEPPGKIVSGEILFHGENLLKIPTNKMRKIRGANISMIFQEPMTSLNPVYQVGDQIAESLSIHQGLRGWDLGYRVKSWGMFWKWMGMLPFTFLAPVRENARELKRKLSRLKIDTPAWQRTAELLKDVGIPEAERRLSCYPFEMSGGMRQRVMIAMAMSCNPEILIADEATTALDVTIQAQILELMKELKRKYGMAIALITHNLAVVAEMSDNIAVMYAGKIVEYGDAMAIFRNPMHPYTWGLLHSIPRVDEPRTDGKLPTIEGMVPNPYNLPVGCKFHPRCFRATQKCKEIEPTLESVNGRQVRCWNMITEGGN